MGKAAMPSNVKGAISKMLEERRSGSDTEVDGSVSREELSRRASKVEFEANRRLAQWTRDLNLTEAQQDKAFAILARASAAYHPALEIEGDTPDRGAEGASGASRGGENVSAPRRVEDKLGGVIDPAQQELFEDELADRAVWWDDVISYLEADLDASTAAAAAAAAAEVAPVPSDYQGDDLSELFGN